MSEETTDITLTVEELQEAQARISELETQLLISQTETEHLRPYQLEANIRHAGFDPESTEGRVLAELAGKDSNLARNPEALRGKAESMGLAPGVLPPPSVMVPPGQVKRLALRDTTRQLASAMKAAEENPELLDG